MPVSMPVSLAVLLVRAVSRPAVETETVGAAGGAQAGASAATAATPASRGALSCSGTRPDRTSACALAESAAISRFAKQPSPGASRTTRLASATS